MSVSAWDSSERAFVETAAHELRAPVGALVVALERLRREDSVSADPSAARLVDLARSEADKLADRVHAAALLGRSIVGVRLEQEPIRVSVLIARVLDRLPVDDTCRVDVDCPSDVTLVADEALLSVCVTNLLENALRADGDGRVGLAVDDGDGAVQIEVSDSGPGLHAVSLRGGDRPLTTVRPAAPKDRAEHGMGLGLTIVARAVEALGGSLGLCPSEGGTVATLTVPTGYETIPAQGS